MVLIPISYFLIPAYRMFWHFPHPCTYWIESFSWLFLEEEKYGIYNVDKKNRIFNGNITKQSMNMLY